MGAWSWIGGSLLVRSTQPPGPYVLHLSWVCWHRLTSVAQMSHSLYLISWRTIRPCAQKWTSKRWRKYALTAIWHCVLADSTAIPLNLVWYNELLLGHKRIHLPCYLHRRPGRKLCIAKSTQKSEVAKVTADALCASLQGVSRSATIVAAYCLFNIPFPSR